MEDIIRIGIVSSVDTGKCTAKVLFTDRDEAVSHDLRIVVPQTMKTKHYWLPDVNEQVLCIFLPIGQETGFIIGSIYSQADKTPVQDGNKKGVWFEDGTFIEYDASKSTLTINALNPIKVNGDLHVEGNIISGGGG